MREFVKKHGIKIILLIVLVSILGILFYIRENIDVESSKINIEGMESFDDNWYLWENGEKIILKETSRTEAGKLKGSLIIYHDTEVTDKKHDLIDVITKNEKIKVFVDNKLIYQYGYESDYNENIELGAIQQIIYLPDDYLGKTIRMELTPVNGSLGTSPYDINIGNNNSFFVDFLMRNITNLIVCGLLIIVMFVFIFMGIWGLVNKNRQHTQMLYFALFIFIALVWNFADKLYLQFFIKNKMISYIIFASSFYLLVTPYCLYMADVFPKYKSSFNILAVVSCLYTMLRVILYLCGIMRFEQMLFVVHIFIGIAIVFSLICCLTEQKNKIYNYRTLAIGSLVFLELISLIVFYAQNKLIVYRYDYSSGFFFGYVIFIVLYIFQFIKERNELRSEMEQAIYYKKVAYIDKLTGIGNRTLFDEHLEEIAKKEKLKSVGIIMMDLNNLKTTNDTYGHYAGDVIICTLSNIFKAALGEKGTAYRIGGDEIVGILKNISKPEITEIVECFNEKISEYNKLNNIQIDYAIGIAYEDNLENNEIDIHDVFTTADAYMYDNKVQSKKLKKKGH